MPKVEIKRKYVYFFGITAIRINNSGPDEVTVLHRDLESMEEVIPLMDSLPDEPDITYYITVTHTSTP